MKVALVYDRVNKWGGAERVLLALHKLFPDAPLYTSVYNNETAKWAKVFTVIPSFLQNFPKATSTHEWYAPLMPLAFESFSFDEYDLVISVTSEAAKGIITQPKTKHICYCLTPTRYLWSGFEEYFSNKLFRFLTFPLTSYLRWWDTAASKRPDAYIAISEEVKKRIKTYYNRSAQIVYPPVTIQELGDRSQEIEDMPISNSELLAPYFLIVSRLVPYKRVDLAVKACTALNIPLKVIGTGSERVNLKKVSGPTIEFLGNLTDSEVVRYYKNCKGFLFPGNEDFGISVLEAQQQGKPVLAFRAGGVLETVIEGKTGMFFDKQTISSMKEALEKFTKVRYNPEDCRKQAEKFSEKYFREQFTETVNRLL